jgi:hypothetical protein
MFQMKTLALIWSLFYFLLTSGVNIGLHFCKGNLAEFSLKGAVGLTCGPVEDSAKSSSSLNHQSCNADEPIAHTCGISKESCCEDVELKVFSPDTQLGSNLKLNVNPTSKADLGPLYPSFNKSFTTNLWVVHQYSNPPPSLKLGKTGKLYLDFHQLVFYA